MHVVEVAYHGPLAKLLRKAGRALHFNDHIAEPGDIVFRHGPAKLGLEGIVSRAFF